MSVMKPPLCWVRNGYRPCVGKTGELSPLVDIAGTSQYTETIVLYRKPPGVKDSCFFLFWPFSTLLIESDIEEVSLQEE
jgi:hypothetical protein